MRLLMLTQNIGGWGGTYARCFSMARGLVSRGHQVTVLAAPRRLRLFPAKYTSQGVQVFEMSGLLPARVRHGGLSPLDLISRILYVLQNEFDLIHCIDHRPTVSIPAILHSHLRHIPCVADWCDLWGTEGLGGNRTGLERLLLSPFDERLERWMINQANSVTVISTELERRALQQGKDARHILLLPPASNHDLIRPFPVEEARRKHSVPLDVPVLVFSGYTGFGAELLGEAFVQLLKRNPSTLILMIGGRLRDFERIVSAQGLGKNVIHFGSQPYEHLGGLLACGDVMLLPYPDLMIHRAGFGNKLADYLAAGRPVATNLTGDVGSLVVKENIGVATSDHPQAYADGISELLADRELRMEMGKRARELAETSFSWETRASQLENFYLQNIEAMAQIGPRVP